MGIHLPGSGVGSLSQQVAHAAIRIRKATEADAAAITEIIEGIASEGVYTAISRPWSCGEQRAYLSSLSARDTVHVAETENGFIIGYQTLERWAATLDSMAHVAQIGTFLRPEWRGRRIGQELFQATIDFAREHGFLKFVAQVRASNVSAQRFYQGLGFRECGRLTRQVRIGECEDDEILMEAFIQV